jgi:hypothetical protein
MTLAINFSTGAAGFVDIMGTISDYLQLKVKLKEKIFLYVYYPKVSKQNKKNFSD